MERGKIKDVELMIIAYRNRIAEAGLEKAEEEEKEKIALLEKAIKEKWKVISCIAPRGHSWILKKDNTLDEATDLADFESVKFENGFQILGG